MKVFVFICAFVNQTFGIAIAHMPANLTLVLKMQILVQIFDEGCIIKHLNNKLQSLRTQQFYQFTRHAFNG